MRKSAGFSLSALKAFMAQSGRGASLAEPAANDSHHASDLWQTGLAAIDMHLPAAGLDRYAVHEVEPFSTRHMQAASLFTLGLLARLRGTQPVLWCHTSSHIREYGRPYAFGLERFGFDPAQLVLGDVGPDRNLPFALEEALKTTGITAVVGEGFRPDFTLSRRLSLLARRVKCPCILLSPPDGQHGSAALTRWRVAAEPGPKDANDPKGPGLTSWRVALTRTRGGIPLPAIDTVLPLSTTPYPWRITWDEETNCFTEAAPVSRRTLHEPRETSRPDRTNPSILGRATG